MAARAPSTGSGSTPGSIPRWPKPGRARRIAGTAITSFFARFRLTGWKRLLNEAASEGLTLGAGGFVVLYVLAIPALTEFDEEQVSSPASTASSSSIATATRSASAASCTTTPCRWRKFPTHLIKATLATEDRRFFEHFGVDFLGTARALVENARPTRWCRAARRSPSSWPKTCSSPPSARSSAKSRRPFWPSCWKSRFTKREILKLYLDRAYLGGGAFGVEAASQFYFGKSVREVNLGRSGLAGRPVQGAVEICAPRQSAGVARPHQRGPEQSRRRRLHERRARCTRPG